MVKLFASHRPKRAPARPHPTPQGAVQGKPQGTTQGTPLPVPGDKAGPAPDPQAPKEIGGPSGPEPTRYGDWERKGICVDF